MGGCSSQLSAPSAGRQLSLPGDRPIGDLLPALIDLVGESSGEGGAWSWGGIRRPTSCSKRPASERRRPGSRSRPAGRPVSQRSTPPGRPSSRENR